MEHTDTLAAFLQQYQLRLNPIQYKAAAQTEGPLLLLAVPGSGKTTVLVTRLGYMIINQGIDPASILTMTYTVSAARDMADRYRSMFGETAGPVPEFRTINGVCAKIILYYARYTGGNAFELESNEKVLNSIVAGIYTKAVGEYPTEGELKDLRTRFSYAKNMMLSEAERKEMNAPGLPFSELFDAYNRQLKDRHRMDYDDQMVYAYRILRSYPEILAAFRRQYTYICVDEAQDTSKIQHRIIALLAGGKENLFMVGDEDQSIYGFRAAWPEALLSFAEDHPNAVVLLMEENFRSQPAIVDAANRFICKNSFRYSKEMRAMRTGDNRVTELTVTAPIGQLEACLYAARTSTVPFAVLYRDNESGVPLADALLRENIPFSFRKGDLTFFHSRPVRDITDFLQFALHPKDREAFSRIYYKMNLYLKKELLTAVSVLARNADVPLLEAVRFCRDCSAHTRTAALQLSDLFDNICIQTPADALKTVLYDCGYNDYLNRSGLRQNTVRMLQQLSLPCKSVPEFLDRLEKLPDLLETKNEGNVTLSTIHSAKGLEYDTVFLLDVFDGIFPEKTVPDVKKASTSELKTYEEERRLFYVGITRAKNRLFLFTSIRYPSTFCRELLSETATCGSKEQKKAPADYDQFCAGLVPGASVLHKVFGRAVVKEIDRDAQTVCLCFDREAPRVFYLRTLYDRKLLVSDG